MRITILGRTALVLFTLIALPVEALESRESNSLKQSDVPERYTHVTLEGKDYWEGTFGGFDAKETETGSAVTFKVFGSQNDKKDNKLFWFRAEDAGDNVTLTLDSSGLGVPIEKISLLLTDGQKVEIPNNNNLVTITIKKAGSRWCNPFIGCRFEFWRRSRAVEQSFTFASPVDITILGRDFYVQKVSFIPSQLQKKEPEFTKVEISPTKLKEEIDLLNVSTKMPPVAFEGLFHHIKGRASLQEVTRGVLEVKPFDLNSKSTLLVKPGSIQAWQSHFTVNFGQQSEVLKGSSLTFKANSPLQDRSLVTAAVLRLQPENQKVKLSAAFDTDSYDVFLLNESEITGRALDVLAGQAAVELATIPNVCDSLVPEIGAVVGCPRIVFRSFPQFGDLCGWVIEMPMAIQASVLNKTNGNEQKVLADTIILREKQEGGRHDHSKDIPMTFEEISIEAIGINKFSIFDQAVTPSQIR